MQLFSKRYLRASRRFRYNSEENSFLSPTLRNRLVHEVSYLVSSNDYLEGFLIVHDENNETHFFHQETLKKLSVRELGYDINDVYNARELTLKEGVIDDAKFFDLIEIIIIFTKEEKRDDLILRLRTIFTEEASLYSIHSYMIVDRNETGLRSIFPLIKSDVLKEKLSEFYEMQGIKPNYQALARISADIIQFLFSSPKGQKETKRYSEKLCREVSKRLTKKEHVDSFDKLITSTVLNAKSLSNQIENVRHTDRSSIPVDTPNFYKLITSGNISIAELVILSTPEKYILEKNPDEMKSEYFDRYKIERNSGWRIERKEKRKDEVRVEDLPF